MSMQAMSTGLSKVQRIEEKGEDPIKTYFPMFLNNTALCLMHMGKSQNAMIYFEKAYEQATFSLPKKSSSCALVGQTYCTNRLPFIAYNIGLALIKSGDSLNALDYLKYATKYLPSNPYVRHAVAW